MQFNINSIFMQYFIHQFYLYPDNAIMGSPINFHILFVMPCKNHCCRVVCMTLRNCQQGGGSEGSLLDEYDVMSHYESHSKPASSNKALIEIAVKTGLQLVFTLLLQNWVMCGYVHTKKYVTIFELSQHS